VEHKDLGQRQPSTGPEASCADQPGGGGGGTPRVLHVEGSAQRADPVCWPPSCGPQRRAGQRGMPRTGQGGRAVADGAASVVWAATLPDGGPTGGFFRDGHRVPC